MSPHADVWMTCIFPDAQLDKLLRLEERIRMKLAQASASVGLDSEVIPGATAVEMNFADSLDAIEQGLESQMRALPGAAGSGLRQGKERGHFFCAKVDDKVLLRFVPWSRETAIVGDALGCLRRIT